MCALLRKSFVEFQKEKLPNFPLCSRRWKLFLLRLRPPSPLPLAVASEAFAKALCMELCSLPLATLTRLHKWKLFWRPSCEAAARLAVHFNGRDCA
jgi:hypothetical protein